MAPAALVGVDRRSSSGGGDEGGEIEKPDEGDVDAALIVLVNAGVDDDTPGRGDIATSELEVVAIIGYIGEAGGGHKGLLSC
jgi:hypothetical protein